MYYWREFDNQDEEMKELINELFSKREGSCVVA